MFVSQGLMTYLLVSFALAVLVSLTTVLSGLDAGLSIYVMSLALVVVAVTLVFCWWWQTRRLFDPFILFFFSVFIFHAGYAVLTTFGVEWPHGIIELLDPLQLPRAFLMSFVAITVFGMGGMMAVSGHSMRHQYRMLPESPFNPTWYEQQAQSLRVVGFVMLFVAIGPTVHYVIQDAARAYEGGYLVRLQHERDAGVYELLRFIHLYFVPACVLLIAGSKNHPHIAKSVLLLVILYGGTYLFIGQRSVAANALISAFVTYHLAVRRFKALPILVSAALIVLVVFPTINSVRNIPGKDRLNPDAYVEAFEALENPMVDILANFGGTMTHLGWVQALVPHERDLAYGMTYLNALVLTFIPVQLWDANYVKEQSLAYWTVWTVTPGAAADGVGWGYSMFAEAFVNFGWAGVVLFALLIGYGFARLTLWALASPYPSRIAMLCIILVTLLVVPRAEMIGVFRSVLWFAVFPYLAVQFVQRYIVTHSAYATCETNGTAS